MFGKHSAEHIVQGDIQVRIIWRQAEEFVANPAPRDSKRAPKSITSIRFEQECEYLLFEWSELYPIPEHSSRSIHRSLAIEGRSSV
jgi:hypothetical protein